MFSVAFSLFGIFSTFCFENVQIFLVIFTKMVLRNWPLYGSIAYELLESVVQTLGIHCNAWVKDIPII